MDKSVPVDRDLPASVEEILQTLAELRVLPAVLVEKDAYRLPGLVNEVATLDWRPSVNHPLIRCLTPALRPLFRSNHNWAMRRGERQIREYLHAT